LIAKVKENQRIRIPIFGNGDIDSPEKALEYKNRYGVDGIMIGRASIGYPWIFKEIKHFLATGEKLPVPTLVERANACRRHFEFSVKWKGDKAGVFEMRRHYSNYFKGLENFKEERSALVLAADPKEIIERLEAIPTKYEGMLFG
jgi:tRNA-dihydrouridine synthase